MSEAMMSARFGLPLLAVNQAQKEVTHNESITAIDMLLHPSVGAGPLNAPPASPQAGQCWLIGAAPTGAWSGRPHHLAAWTAGGWRFAPPHPAMRIWRSSDGHLLRYDGNSWVEPALIAEPAGGSVIDSEARAAINSVILVLKSYGLLRQN